MKGRTAIAVVLALSAAAPPPPPGASSCSGCHGAAAPIAGHDAKTLTEALIAFRSGARESTVMGRIAKGFEPTELNAIAAWWSEAPK
jgi:sulfide dehydrogenase cytochrome subunit